MFDVNSRIWHNGEFIHWHDAKIHVASHCIHYGTSIFEGIRAYETPHGAGIFRLTEHMERLIHSAHIYQIPLEYTLDDLRGAAFALLSENGMTEGYLRPLVLRGYGRLGVDPRPNPVETYMMAWKWGLLLGHASGDSGVHACVSSWRRPAPDTLPMMAKSGANYMNSQLIKLEAMSGGFDEGIALDIQGNVSEGSGENIFLVKKGVLYTPPLSSSILPGITRDSIIELASDMGIPCDVAAVPREMLYTADELFFCGTAAEIAPISSVDRRTISTGKAGEITRALQAEFRKITRSGKDKRGWMEFASINEPAKRIAAL